MSKRLLKIVRDMTDTELCEYLICEYKVNKAIVKEMNELTLPAEGEYIRYPELETFYKFVLLEVSPFTA